MMAGVIPGQKKDVSAREHIVIHPDGQNAGIRGLGHVVMWE